MDRPPSREIVGLSRPISSRLRSGLIIPTLPQILNELVQNSLDAGASRIECWINLEKGYEMIKVEDDGHGMNAEDLSLIPRVSGQLCAYREILD
jgi:DNA mismatch repair protein MLH3